MAERLNSLAARHWRQFSGQNYFDPNGVFLSAVLSAPLVFTMFVILVGFDITDVYSGDVAASVRRHITAPKHGIVTRSWAVSIVIAAHESAILAKPPQQTALVQ